MAHILDKYDEKKHFFSDPFPHIIIEDCLDEESYDILASNFPANEDFEPCVKQENQAYWITASDLASTSHVWADLIEEHLSPDFISKAIQIISPFMQNLSPDFVKNLGKELHDCRFGLAEKGGLKNVRNKDHDVVISISAGINTPTTIRSVLEPPHADVPQKLFNCMLYMRSDDDDSSGGDLTLYETSDDFLFTSKSETLYEVEKKYLKEIKTLKYSKNLLLLFPHKNNAIHGLTARGPTLHTRRYINLNMESYILNRGVFFETPRSRFANAKFALKRSTLFRGLRKLGQFW